MSRDLGLVQVVDEGDEGFIPAPVSSKEMNLFIVADERGAWTIKGKDVADTVKGVTALP